MSIILCKTHDNATHSKKNGLNVTQYFKNFIKPDKNLKHKF